MSYFNVSPGLGAIGGNARSGDATGSIARFGESAVTSTLARNGAGRSTGRVTARYRRVAAPRAFRRRDGSMAFLAPGGLGAASYFFTNTTKPDTPFAVGDSWTLDISGAPNSPVFIAAKHNGQDMGRTQMGSTDSAGKLRLASTMSSNELGIWDEVISVGSDSVGLTFEVLPPRAAASNPWQPSSASSVAPILSYTPESTMSNVPGMSVPVSVPTLKAYLSAQVSDNERDYLLTDGVLPTPEGCPAWLQGVAQRFCQLYPDACAGSDVSGLVSSLCAQYKGWYIPTLSAYYNIQDRSGGTPLSTAPPRPAGYVYPTTFTSGPGYAAQQTGATPQQAQAASIAAQERGGASPTYDVSKSAPPIPQTTNTGSNQGGSGASSSTGGGASAPPASGAWASDFFNNTFDIAGYSVPVWGLGVGVLGLFFLPQLMGRR